MKKVTAFFLVLALLLCNVVAVSAATPEGEALVDVAYVGEDGLIELTIRTETPTAAGNFTVTFDNRTLTLKEALPATDYSSVKTEASTVSCSFVNRPAKDGALATIRFAYDATAPKTTKLEIALTLIDGEEQTTKQTKSLVLDLAAKEALCPSQTFEDLNVNEWYHDATDYAISNGIMRGISETTFDPEGTTTRAMFVTILGRAAGIDTEGYGAKELFEDVPAEQWYTAYVNWACEKGITNGREEGRFCPNEPVTRQEMVTLLARFAAVMGEDTALENTDNLKSFADADLIADYAVEAFAWAVERGIINGTGAGLEPEGVATRAQIAQIIYKYLTF